MWLFFISAFSPAGVVFNTYMFSGINVSAIDDMGREFAVNFDGIMNLTEIDVDGERYFVDEENMEIIRDGEGYILAYHDTPALRAGLAGVIIDIDGKQIRHSKDLEHVLGEEKPGTKVKIKTLLNDSIKEYDLELAEHPQDETKAYLGIAFLRGSDSGLLGKLRSNIVFFKDPNTYYKPAVAENLMIFIYNLLWWIVLINLSVGLVNMLPIGIFDGGRVFFLTVLGLTKSEKVAKKAFRFSTMLLLFVFLLLTYLWFVNFFFR
jgi:membrane-associated protease RseP (regulator of RpoE activity)